MGIQTLIVTGMTDGQAKEVIVFAGYIDKIHK